jgi:GDP-L-fucose synthase
MANFALPKGPEFTEASSASLGNGRDTELEIPLTLTGEAAAVGYLGNIELDPKKPDGAPRKWLDSSRLNRLGWNPLVNLNDGLQLAYQEFLQRPTN